MWLKSNFFLAESNEIPFCHERALYTKVGHGPTYKEIKIKLALKGSNIY